MSANTATIRELRTDFRPQREDFEFGAGLLECQTHRCLPERDDLDAVLEKIVAHEIPDPFLNPFAPH